MDLDRVHITAVARDPNASARYSAPDDTPSDDPESNEEETVEREDRIEISARGRESFLEHMVTPEFDFARKALGRLPSAPPERVSQLTARIESGYYSTSVVLDQLVARMVGG